MNIFCLLIDVMFARNYPLAYIDLPGPSPRNPILEDILPSLLHIKAVSILDHALRAWIDINGLKVPRKPYGTGLEGRINYLVDHQILKDPDSIHALRKVRNDLAHEPQNSVSWEGLDRDLETMHLTLKTLNIVGYFPNFKIMSERSGARGSTEPGVSFSFDYRIMVKEDEQVVSEIKWTKNIHKDEY